MTVIGALGSARRDQVTAWGAVVPGDGSPTLDWLVAAEDRWHRPVEEPSVRQGLLEGTPVVETRLRVPGGDVVHRVAVVADRGGLTLVEIANESPLPVAVALTRPDLWWVRLPTEVPTPGTELPPGSVILPLGHRATVRAGLPHGPVPTGPLPGDVGDTAAAVRGWRTLCDRTGRLNLPEPATADAWVAARCQSALCLTDDMPDDPVGWLLRCTEAVRLGEPASRWLPEVVGAVERAMRRGSTWGRRRRGSRSTVTWDLWRALLGAEAIIRTSGDDRALADATHLLGLVTSVASEPLEAPAAERATPWYEDRLVRPEPGGALTLFPHGIPTAWFGQSLEVHDLSVGGGRTLSFALRWHGERPALLWEVATEAPPTWRTSLRGGGLDPAWSSGETRGEALLAVPPGAPPVT